MVHIFVRFLRSILRHISISMLNCCDFSGHAPRRKMKREIPMVGIFRVRVFQFLDTNGVLHKSPGQRPGNGNANHPQSYFLMSAEGATHSTREEMSCRNR